MKKSGKAEKWAARSERLSAALRENLKRRKAQTRGRATEPALRDGSVDAAPEPDRQAPDFRRNRSTD
ncbi:MAG: hypothetical protein ACRECV_08890 [Xanthobacteraceae bacterium]